MKIQLEAMTSIATALVQNGHVNVFSRLVLKPETAELKMADYIFG